MNLYSEGKSYKLYSGNMLDMLDVIQPNSIDAIVTDPPYELGFMNKSWDSSGIAFQVDTWKKCLTVLKPGGHLLCFGASRNFHRVACAIEDAGFEIRDTIMWLYGGGFPKGMNIGLNVDKRNGVESEIIGYQDSTMPDFIDAGQKNLANGGENKVGFNPGETAERKQMPIYKVHNRWDGWNTTLKPCYEPIIMARKPCEGSCIDNVMKWEVGGINIKECQVPFKSDKDYHITADKNQHADFGTKPLTGNVIYGDYSMIQPKNYQADGRYPGNVILSYDDDTFDEVCGGMPYTVSTGGSGEASKINTFAHTYSGGWGKEKDCAHLGGLGDEGSAARYFYTAKASVRDRDEGLPEGEHNIHTTVKPCDLMSYLVRLVTPKGGTVLDPFNGSGSTGKAVAYENYDREADYKYIGIELSEEYLAISDARIKYVESKLKQIKLF